MGVFSGGGVGIDLGSSNTTIYLENAGIALREPTCVLSQRDNLLEALAVGKEAQQMQGRIGAEIVVVNPVVDGGIADVSLAALVMMSLAEKAIGRRKPLEKNQLCVTMPQLATRVERDALITALQSTGARRAFIAKTPIAAAMGSGLRVDKANGMLLVDIGGSLTEISVISMYGVAAARTLKTGSRAFDEAIVRHIRRERGILLSEQSAEELKMDAGSATLSATDASHEIRVYGQYMVNGRPMAAMITHEDLYHALEAPIAALLDGISDALYHAPPELSSDIVESGIRLTGGGAKLAGLAARLQAETGLTVTTSVHPQDDAAIGAGMLAMDERLTHQLVLADSAYEA